MAEQERRKKDRDALESSAVYKCVHTTLLEIQFVPGSRNRPLQNANLPTFPSDRLLSFFFISLYPSRSASVFLSRFPPRGARAFSRFSSHREHVTRSSTRTSRRLVESTAESIFGPSADSTWKSFQTGQWVSNEPLFRVCASIFLLSLSHSPFSAVPFSTGAQSCHNTSPILPVRKPTVSFSS